MADPNTSEGRLQGIAGQIAGLNLELLIHPTQGGNYNYEPNRPLLKFIQSFYADIASTDISNIPSPVLDSIFAHAGNVQRSLNAIKDFNFRQGDPNQSFNALIQNLQNQWREAYNYAISHIAFAKVSSSAIAQELERTKATVNGIQSVWEKASAEYKTQKETADKLLAERISEFEKVLAAAREASGKEAVSRQASEFEGEARKCLTASRWWFGGTILVVAVSLVVVYFMFLKDLHKPLIATATQSPITNQPPIASLTTRSDNTPASDHAITIEALQQTIARVLIVTLLYSAVVWCARNYFASRHNYTVNRHRRNAMQTFRAFVEGTKDPATQDFILRQAAACAFAPQQTGYLKDESLPTPAPTSQFIDMAKPGGN